MVSVSQSIESGFQAYTLFQSKDEPGGESEEWRRKVPFWVGFGFEKF